MGSAVGDGAPSVHTAPRLHPSTGARGSFQDVLLAPPARRAPGTGRSPRPGQGPAAPGVLAVTDARDQAHSHQSPTS